MAPQCTAKWDASDFSPVCNCVCTRMGSDIGRDQLLPLESHRNAFFSSVAYHWVHFTGTEILRYYIYLKVKIGHNRFALKGQGAGWTEGITPCHHIRARWFQRNPINEICAAKNYLKNREWYSHVPRTSECKIGCNVCEEPLPTNGKCWLLDVQHL